MGRKAQYNWPELFQQFHASGLNQSQFCKQQKLNPKYFSKKLADYSVPKNTTAFAKAVVQPGHRTVAPSCLSLKAQCFTLDIPVQTDPAYVARLLKGPL